MAAKSNSAEPGHGPAAATMPKTEVLRAYRFALDPSDAERAALSRYAGACRWAYNYALAKKTQAHQAWADRRTAYLEAGLSEAEAKERIKADGAELTDRIKVWDHHRKSLTLTVAGKPPLPEMQPPAGQETLVHRLVAVRADAAETTRERELLAEARATVNALKTKAFSAGFRTPTATDTSALWRVERDLPKEQRGSPWWREVNVYCFTSGFDRAQVAWNHWQDSLAGRHAGRRHGYPRFKKKGHAESFTLFHDVKRPIIRLEGYRRLVMPGLGSIRIHNSGKRLALLVDGGQAVIQSVTVTRGGHRWYASVLAKVQQNVPMLWEHVHDDGTRTPYLSRTPAEEAAENGGRVEQIGRPTARQRAGGLVGVDLGSHYLAALSSPLDPADPATALVQHPLCLPTAWPSCRRPSARCPVVNRGRGDGGRPPPGSPASTSRSPCDAPRTCTACPRSSPPDSRTWRSKTWTSQLSPPRPRAPGTRRARTSRSRPAPTGISWTPAWATCVRSSRTRPPGTARSSSSSTRASPSPAPARSARSETQAPTLRAVRSTAPRAVRSYTGTRTAPRTSSTRRTDSSRRSPPIGETQNARRAPGSPRARKAPGQGASKREDTD